MAILNYSMNKFSYFDLMAASQKMELESLTSLQDTLLKLLFVLLGSILLLFLLIFLNIAVTKTIVWTKTLNKKIKFKVLVKAFILDIFLAVLFIIPLIISLAPLLRTNELGMLVPVLNQKATAFVPLIFVLFVTFYFTTIAQYLIAKTGKIWKSLTDMFKFGILKVKAIFLPYFFTFLALAGILKTMANLGFFWSWIGWLMFLLILIKLSFMYRLHLSKVI
jgi:hypothetical protein